MEKTGMKSKTIKSILSKKITEWTNSITDDQLKRKVRENVIVTGGAITSMLMGEEVNDYDVYFRDHDTTLLISKYYLDLFKSKTNAGKKMTITDFEGRIKIVIASDGVAEDKAAIRTTPTGIEEAHEESEQIALTKEDEKDKPKFQPVFLTSNAITLTGKVQIVIRFYGEPDVIHENYDFAHCTNYWQGWDGQLILRPIALETILSKTLLYQGSKYPICSLIRTRKFIERGWKINAGQFLKMAMQISKLNLEDMSVLEDQLTGVDTAYFNQLITALKENNKDVVDASYLVEIVDRIF